MSKPVENLFLYDPEFEAAARAYLGDGGGEICPVKSIQDFKDAGNNYTSVKFLMVILHGLPGKLVLASGGQILGFQGLIENSSFIQREARILFASCLVGAGSEGDKFIDSVGKNFLAGKGGYVGATTSINLIPRLPLNIGPFMMPLSFGRLKVKRYDDQGNEVASRTVDRHGIRR